MRTLIIGLPLLYYFLPRPLPSFVALCTGFNDSDVTIQLLKPNHLQYNDERLPK
jgi:hypothetical protein